jgi:hypothetical protein
MVVLTTSPTFSMLPLPSDVLSMQGFVFIGLTMFQFVSTVMIWMAAKEGIRMNKEESERKSSEEIKDASMLKF